MIQLFLRNTSIYMIHFSEVFTTTEIFQNTPFHQSAFTMSVLFQFNVVAVIYSILLAPCCLWSLAWFSCRKFWIQFWEEGKTETVGERLMISFCCHVSSLCQRSEDPRRLPHPYTASIMTPIAQCISLMKTLCIYQMTSLLVITDYWD